MERYIYISEVGVDYEGVNLAGIHTTLEEAKAKIELVHAEIVASNGDWGTTDNSFYVRLWDTQTQSHVYSWEMDRKSKVWESWGQILIEVERKIDNKFNS